jgi:hypothetical protein
MSLIASFWTLTADRRAELVEAFKFVLPQNSSLFSASLPESAVLSEFSGAAVALIDASARDALSRLLAVSLSRADVARFLESDGRPLADHPAEAEPVLAAPRYQTRWAKAVKPGRIGLMMIS